METEHIEDAAVLKFFEDGIRKMLDSKSKSFSVSMEAADGSEWTFDVTLVSVGFTVFGSVIPDEALAL